MEIKRMFRRLFAMVLLCAVPLLSSAGDLRIVVLSVNSGDTSLIIFPNNKTMLIDTGVTNETSRTVIPFLQRHGITKLDYFLGTHVHPDHTDGIPVLQAAGFIDAATTVWDWNTFDIYDSFTIEGTSWLIYNARDTAANGTDANYNSVSYRMEYNGFVYSGSGDEGTTSMNRFLKDYPNLVPAHVRNTAHHGYGPVSSSFLTKLNSRLYIVSCSTACTSYSAYKTIGTVATQVGGARVLTATSYNGGRGHIYIRAASSTDWNYQTYSTTQTIPNLYSLAPNDAQFVSQTVPSTLVAGQTAAVTVKMKNTGAEAWSIANGHKLGSQNAQDSTTWGMSRVGVPSGVTVAAGQEYTFSFNITAPATAGTYNFQWKMVDDVTPNQGWFGALTSNKAITVTSSAPTLPVVSFLAPASLTVMEGTNLYVNVSATDPDGISRVYLSRNGVPLARSEGGAPYEWNAVGQSDPELQNLQPGSFTLTAKAVDTVGSYTEKTITITVQAANQPPYFTSNPFSKPDATVGVAYSQSFSGQAVDPEGGTKTFSKVSGPEWLSVATNGNATGTPASVDIGTNSFQVKVTDNGALSATATMTIKVLAPVTPPQTVTFTSISAEDGYLNESTETSNIGGGFNAAGTAGAGLRIGDTTTKQQHKSIVSFDTSSIPDGAVIQSATLKLMRGAISGTVTNLGLIKVDIKGATGFNGSTALQNQDFEAASDATNVATMSYPTANGTLSTGSLSATGLTKVNKTGKTQLRVYFATDDNNNGTSDYLGFYPAENGTVANRPVLVVTYQ